MNYDQIIVEFRKMINDDFTMQTLKDLRKIYYYLNRAYRYETLKIGSNKNLCAIIHEKYLTYVNDNVALKLKETFNLNDEIINKIIYCISSIDRIEDIYISDKDVFAKYSVGNYSDNRYSTESQYASLESNFFDITTKKFAQNNDGLSARLVAMSINNVTKSLINLATKEDILTINNSDICYTIPDLKIFCNRNLSDILSDKTGSKITKVLVTYQDKNFYLDMKIRDDFVIICRNVEEIKALSEMLNSKENQKTKK